MSFKSWETKQGCQRLPLHLSTSLKKNHLSPICRKMHCNLWQIISVYLIIDIIDRNDHLDLILGSKKPKRNTMYGGRCSLYFQVQIIQMQNIELQQIVTPKNPKPLLSKIPVFSKYSWKKLRTFAISSFFLLEPFHYHTLHGTGFGSKA